MRTSRRVVAGGGGSAEQEASALSRFASLVPTGGTVLNIPWALPDPKNHDSLTWVISTLGAFGVRHIRSLTSVTPTISEIEEADAVFIGGGNTFLLLQRLRDTGVGHALVKRVRQGMPCYGGSAGAIVLGNHVGTAAYADSNDVGLTDLSGLDLFDGCALWCHFTDTDEPKLREYRRMVSVPVIAIPENAGVAVDSGRILAIGPGLVTIWRGASSIDPTPLSAS